MEFSKTLLNELEELVSKLDEHCVLDRHIAIREAARLLICLANEEHYNDTDAFDQSYSIIADACQSFVERK